MGPFYISGNGNPKKSLIIQEVTFRARKVKKNPLLSCFLYSEKWNFVSPTLKSFLYVSMGTISAEARKVAALAFVRFKRCQSDWEKKEALSKKLLEHLMAIFGILNDITV